MHCDQPNLRVYLNAIVYPKIRRFLQQSGNIIAGYRTGQAASLGASELS